LPTAPNESDTLSSAVCCRALIFTRGILTRGLSKIFRGHEPLHALQHRTINSTKHVEQDKKLRTTIKNHTKIDIVYSGTAEEANVQLMNANDSRSALWSTAGNLSLYNKHLHTGYFHVMTSKVERHHTPICTHLKNTLPFVVLNSQRSTGMK